MAKIVRNNKGITGFSLGNDEVKISQHADDAFDVELQRKNWKH